MEPFKACMTARTEVPSVGPTLYNTFMQAVWIYRTFGLTEHCGFGEVFQMGGNLKIIPKLLTKAAVAIRNPV